LRLSTTGSQVCEVVAVTDSPGGGGDTSVLGTSSVGPTTNTESRTMNKKALV